MNFPPWLLDLLCLDRGIEEHETIVLGGDAFVLEGGVLRSKALLANAGQVQRTFGYKWNQRETFESETVRAANRAWLIQRYGDMSEADWITNSDSPPIVLDAGCGAAFSAVELFSSVLHRIRYLGVDFSVAVNIARDRIQEIAGSDAAFIQSDLIRLPIRENSIDAIFSEGVLHHTPAPDTSLMALTRLLKPGGRMMFYVYRTKGAIREFTDDYIRDLLRNSSAEEAWRRIVPLTKLGKVLGDLNIEIEIPEAISLLDIPAGRIDLQRLFYWHIMKLYYRPEYSIGEMNHVNFDWYTPQYAHRQTPEQVRAWCADSGLVIDREVVDLPGITILARRG